MYSFQIMSTISFQLLQKPQSVHDENLNRNYGTFSEHSSLSSRRSSKGRNEAIKSDLQAMPTRSDEVDNIIEVTNDQTGDIMSRNEDQNRVPNNEEEPPVSKKEDDV